MFTYYIAALRQFATPFTVGHSWLICNLSQIFRAFLLALSSKYGIPPVILGFICLHGYCEESPCLALWVAELICWKELKGVGCESWTINKAEC